MFSVVITPLGILEGFRKLRGNIPKETKEEQECAEKVKAYLEEGNDVRFGEWGLREIEVLNTWQLLTAKPVVYLVNLTAKDYIRKKNKWLVKIFEWVQVSHRA
jgi:obg-like ATPase 1